MPTKPGLALCVTLGLAAGLCATTPAGSEITPSATAPLVIGHRGASGYRPEHTLAAYALALEQGADFIEPDLVITADGVLVARHENEIGGTTDIADRPEFAARRATKTIDGRATEGWFTEDFTLAELKTLRARERIPQLRGASAGYDGQFDIPTFDEVIALLREHNERKAAAARSGGLAEPAPAGLYPETKHPTYFANRGTPLEPPLVAALERAGLNSRDAPVFIQSFETGNLRRLKEQTPVRLIQLLADEGAPFDLVAAGSTVTYSDLAKPAGLDSIAKYAFGIGVAKELVIPRNGDGALDAPASLVREAHERGLKVHVWTFRRENAFLPRNLQSSDRAADPGALDREVETYLKAGVDGLFSDNPDIAIRARDQFTGR